MNLRTVADVQRLLERVVVEAMALENGHQRNRTLAALAGVALKAVEVGGVEERLVALETRFSGPQRDGWRQP